MTLDYGERQRAQFRRFLAWTKTEGGVEGPTQLDTLVQAEQRLRLDWLRARTFGKALEVGCNWGFVAAYVGAAAGLDINSMNVELARLLAPNRSFAVGDATKLPYADKSFETVLIPETLEHLDFPDGVSAAVQEALRVATARLLITVPDGRVDNPAACNMKHLWLLDGRALRRLTTMLPANTSVTWVAGFCCIESHLEKS